MAVTVSNLDFTVFGDKRVTLGSVTYSTYATGGESLTPSQIGLGTIKTMLLTNPVSSVPAIRGATYNPSTSKLLAYTTSDGAEVANGTDLSAYTVNFEAIGW